MSESTCVVVLSPQFMRGPLPVPCGKPASHDGEPHESADGRVVWESLPNGGTHLIRADF